MACVLPFLVALCIAGVTAQEYTYISQLMMARTQTYEGKATEICQLPLEVGPCNGYYPKYYYDKHEGKCKESVYGGCYGNLNNFDTEGECLKMCGEGISRKFGPKLTTPRPALAAGQIPHICYQPEKRGPCYAIIPRYYYNSTDGICKPFIYGGCDGNGNNFETLVKCYETCNGGPRIPALSRQVLPDSSEPLSVDINPVCNLPKDKGPCEGYFRRWYYNPADGICEKFTYGGCQGNKNNFGTFEECNSTCPRVFELQGWRDFEAIKPQVTSEYRIPAEDEDDLRILVTRKVHSATDEPTYSEEATPHPRIIAPPERSGINICLLPPDRGPCKGNFRKYYYDFGTKSCKEFIYGGCKGNANRFDTKKECTRTCRGTS